MKQALPDIGTHICPSCDKRSPVRLSRGQICASCRSAAAWSEHRQLVISRDDIQEAEARRSHPRRPLGPVLLAVATVALAGTATTYLIGLFLPLPLSGLDVLVASMRKSAMQATLWGLGSLVVGVAALILLRKGRHFHRRLLLASHLLAVLCGGVALIVGAFQWWGVSRSAGMQHLTMPTLEAGISQSVHFDHIAKATAVVLAPDGDGDGRMSGIGTAAVIGTDERRAWLVTCSHVAMPYAAVASWRDPKDAHPVWIQLHDGRSTMGRVTWAAPPPLDVALIEIDVDNPPAPVEISTDTNEMEQGDPVMFVPNPYRHGWMIHYGEIEKRRHHDTPAGPYSLLFTTLPVQPGDSGSGLFDENGLLIGLNTWARFGLGGPRGISLPSETLRALVTAIGENRLHELDSILPQIPATTPE